jgi:hypothetical protein
VIPPGLVDVSTRSRALDRAGGRRASCRPFSSLSRRTRRLHATKRNHLRSGRQLTAGPEPYPCSQSSVMGQPGWGVSAQRHGGDLSDARPHRHHPCSVAHRLRDDCPQSQPRGIRGADRLDSGDRSVGHGVDALGSEPRRRADTDALVRSGGRPRHVDRSERFGARRTDERGNQCRPTRSADAGHR